MSSSNLVTAVIAREVVATSRRNADGLSVAAILEPDPLSSFLGERGGGPTQLDQEEPGELSPTRRYGTHVGCGPTYALLAFFWPS
jgi:hypothetical protein